MNCRKRLCFLPEDFRQRKQHRRTSTLCAAMFLCVMAVIGATIAVSERSLAGIEAEHADVTRQYANAAIRIGQIQQMQDRQHRMTAQAAAAAALVEKMPRSYLLAEVTNALPPGVTLTDLSLDRDSKQSPVTISTARAAASIRIAGMAETDVQIAQFVNQLSRSAVLKNVALTRAADPLAPADQLRPFTIDVSLSNTAVLPKQDQTISTIAVELAPE